MASSLKHMTPQYASPEQLKGQAITTTSDVYSLGVILYEILTGRRPRGLNTRAHHTAGQVICEAGPEKPSAVVGLPIETGQCARTLTPALVGDLRGENIRGLRRRLKGDLDSIVIMALSMDPKGRYSSCDQLSADIGRYLRGLPVVARKSSLVYRGTKFMRRNALALSSALVFVFAVSWFTTDRMARQEMLVRERDRLQYISDFLLDIFEISDPYNANGRTITALELLERGADRAAKELSAEPIVQADIMHTIGMVYYSLGIYDESSALLQEALAARREYLGVDHLDTTESMSRLADVFSQTGDFRKAEDILNRSLAIRRAGLGEAHPAVADNLCHLGILYKDYYGDYNRAERFLNESLEIQRASLGSSDPSIAETLNYLGIVYSSQERYSEAEEVLVESLDISRRISGDRHPRMAVRMHNLGLAYRAQGRLVEAEALERESLNIFENAYSGWHPYIATSLNALAFILKKQENYEEAVALYRRALEIRKEVFGLEHAETAYSLNNLGNLYLKIGRLDEASELLQKAVDVRTIVLGPSHPSTATSLMNLARLRQRQDRNTESEELFRRSIDMFETTGHSRVTFAWIYYAKLLRSMGRGAEAAGLELKAEEFKGS